MRKDTVFIHEPGAGKNSKRSSLVTSVQKNSGSCLEKKKIYIFAPSLKKGT
jgi:hypothetical protein